jgi:MFS family permease
VVFGIMADRVGAPLAGFVSFGSTFVGLGCLLGMEVWPVRLLAYGYVFFLFSAMGSRATIVSVLVGRITPPAHYGIVFGLLGIGNNLGAGLGPVLSGVLYDRTGSYLPVYLAALAVLLLGITALAAFCAITRESG